VRTFPSRFPLFALDRIWVHPRQSLARFHAHVSTAARTASDHLPVVAQLSL
jgi:endonuclease/exonuclease/phosphatase family metal-dependent hydrolase